MQPSKMQLENYFVEELSFGLNNNYKLDSENLPKLASSDLEIEVRLGEANENVSRKMCHLTISPKPKKKFPYEFKIVLIGFFEIDLKCSEEEKAILLKSNAPSMLFTAAREILLLVTGRTRSMPLMLPTVAFLPIPKRGVKINKTLAKKNVTSKNTSGR
jgi:preprotein translocase subunit SecB